MGVYMLKPFYQGKLDTFCAIYAVLNGLRLTHSIRVLKARDILNETLMGLAASPEAFRAVLEQETDYCSLVDGMLRIQGRAFPLEVRQPFTDEDDPSVEQVWDCCRTWLAPGSGRAVMPAACSQRCHQTGRCQPRWSPAITRKQRAAVLCS